MKKLGNGLTVVVSEDHSATTFGVTRQLWQPGDFRIQATKAAPVLRICSNTSSTEGTPNAPKGIFDKVIEGGGGNNNGDTRYDFTEYIRDRPHFPPSIDRPAQLGSRTA